MILSLDYGFYHFIWIGGMDIDTKPGLWEVLLNETVIDDRVAVNSVQISGKVNTHVET